MPGRIGGSVREGVDRPPGEGVRRTMEKCISRVEAGRFSEDVAATSDEDEGKGGCIPPEEDTQASVPAQIRFERRLGQGD